MNSSARGVALVDLIVACAVMVSVCGIAVPALLATHERDVVRLAGRHLASRMQWLRLEALKRNTSVAMRFDPVEVGLVATYVDGDDDGVRQGDVDNGIDRSLAPDGRLADLFAGITAGIARDVPSPDGSGVLTAGSDPIRLGSSNFLTFGPTGGATSGTIYLSGRGGPQVCVRIFGATGRVRVLWFDAPSGTWRHD
jgi:hypothetical protein